MNKKVILKTHLIKNLFENSRTVSGKVITKEAISELPSILQKWLINNGTIGEKPISNVHLTQELELKLSSNQENWNKGNTSDLAI